MGTQSINLIKRLLRVRFIFHFYDIDDIYMEYEKGFICIFIFLGKFLSLNIKKYVYWEIWINLNFDLLSTFCHTVYWFFALFYDLLLYFVGSWYFNALLLEFSGSKGSPIFLTIISLVVRFRIFCKSTV